MNSMIIVAAGKGERFGGRKNKMLEMIGGHPLIWHTLRHVMQSAFLDEIILVIDPAERGEFEKIVNEIAGPVPVRCVAGGPTRMESVACGLAAVSAKSDILLIHDGARPGVGGEAVDRLIQMIGEEIPAALYCIPEIDTVKLVDEQKRVRYTPARSSLLRAQTPQAVRTGLFRECMKKVQEEGIFVTDDMSVCEACGVPVQCIEGKESFFKVTFPEDREKLERQEKNAPPAVRIGQGYDIHRFTESRPLVLGGVRIAENGGLLGHSDADVLIHAVMDALLGAAGCPDIGHFFPDTDDRYRNISSLILLKEVKRILFDRGYRIGNIDSTILAESPRIGPYISDMKKCMAEALEISSGQISIKATTNEKLGAVGRKKGIAALATALVYGGNI